jgi:Secretion system C-terminal sorting domain
VYKARNFVTALAPGATYNDRVICNSQGVYRQAGTSTTEDALLSQLEGMTIAGNQLPVLVYPNPAQQQLYIACNIMDSKIRYEATILDITGKIIATFTLNAADLVNHLDISNLSPSIYCLRVQVGDTQQFVTKFIKE